MFKSEELNSAQEVSPSFTYIKSPTIDTSPLKEGLRQFVSIKNGNLIKNFDYASFNKKNTNSSNESLSVLLNLIKENYISNYKDDTIKSLIVKKLFDNISNNLDCLMVSGIDISSDELHSTILGYINKNFL